MKSTRKVYKISVKSMKSTAHKSPMKTASSKVMKSAAASMVSRETKIHTTDVLIKTSSTDWTKKGRCKCFVSGTADGYIYISGPNNRSYYFLQKLQPSKIPSITISRGNSRIKVGGMQVHFEKPGEFEFFADMLAPFKAKRGK